MKEALILLEALVEEYKKQRDEAVSLTEKYGHMTALIALETLHLRILQKGGEVNENSMY